MSTEHKSNAPLAIRDLWQTPRFVFDYYDRRFGFQWDLAASKKNKLCEYYSDDAFSDCTHGFDGGVWCNPPFSEIPRWVDLCYDISIKSKVPVVLLLPADTSVRWFKRAFTLCTECHLISGRLSFINAETQKAVSGNNKGTVIFIFDSSSPLKSSVALVDREDMKATYND
ncbi:phage N-6-adenine-methyltransferase [Vibrio casei]|uniref:phage N-6-adenine-methyltransferase n=1 Tax=Vibrio casei TaxID=673372 RepID=UPI003F9BE102